MEPAGLPLGALTCRRNRSRAELPAHIVVLAEIVLRFAHDLHIGFALKNALPRRAVSESLKSGLARRRVVALLCFGCCPHSLIRRAATSTPNEKLADWKRSSFFAGMKVFLREIGEIGILPKREAFN